MILEQRGRDFRKITTDKGAPVGFASRLTNDKWCACDQHGVRIERAGVFPNPRLVKKWFESEERI